MTVAAWVFMIAVWTLIIGSMGWCFFKLMTLPSASAAQEPACPVKPGSEGKPS